LHLLRPLEPRYDFGLEKTRRPIAEYDGMSAIDATESTSAGVVTRRAFLRAGGVGLGSLGLSQASVAAANHGGPASDCSVILLLLVGGPSQLETWDPKPDAPGAVRGPFRSIATRTPGVRICEHLPRAASRMDRIALIRSVHHDAAPIHETGHQLLQTGRLGQEGQEAPHFGSMVGWLNGARGQQPVSVILPGAIATTGVPISHGQSSGWLGSAHDAFVLNDDPGSPDFDSRSACDRALALAAGAAKAGRARAFARFEPGEPLPTSYGGRNVFDLNEEKSRIREAYGSSTFGQSCLLARRLIEAGVRVVTVNMYATVFNQATWDCHGSGPFSTLDDYAREVLPKFDRAFSALLDDLADRGRLDSTLVVAAGEFGRTPRLNAAGGRDHWPGAWSVAMAGGGVRGGQVIGSTDADAGSPADRPVTPQDLLATMYYVLGIDCSQYVSGNNSGSTPLVEGGAPIHELFV
jgi:hypothetical protein